MILWIAVLPKIGFVLSGILAFLAIALVIPGATASRTRTLVQTLIAAIVIVSSFYFLLRYGLNVPLPRGILGI
jgi:heme/copper-type cytochrome/quinol oxidase subunit 4